MYMMCAYCTDFNGLMIGDWVYKNFRTCVWNSTVPVRYGKKRLRDFFTESFKSYILVSKK